MQLLIRQSIESTRQALDAILADNALVASLEAVGNTCIEALRNGKKILLAGNGGSAADAQHIAAELVSRLNYDRPGLAAIALTTDTSALTAIGNDYGFEQIFSRQLEAIGNVGDVLIAISTSGNSANILKAVESAKAKNITTIALTGKSGGKLADKCDIGLHMPSSATPHIQECHIMFGHILCQMIEETLFGAEHNPARNAS